MVTKSPLPRLLDMAGALRAIERFIGGVDVQTFRANLLVRSAVERQLEVISEASRHVPSEMKARHPDIPWRKLADLGNILRHAYHRVDPLIVWNIVRDDLPSLKRVVHAMIRDVRRRSDLE